MDPVRKRKGDTGIGNVDNPLEPRSQEQDDIASDKERGQEPCQEQIEKRQHADCFPRDLFALLRERRGNPDEHQETEQIDAKRQIHKNPSQIISYA